MLAVALCVLSAAAYALGALWQQRVAKLPLLRQIRAPRFWMGAVCNGAGMVLHITALRFGSLALVQALGVLTLVLAVLYRGRGARRTELIAAAVTAAGLAGLLAVLGTARPVALTSGQMTSLLLVAAAVLGVLAFGALRPGLHLSAGGGIAFGVASAVTQTVTLNFSLFGVAAIVALDLVGIWFTQLGYRRGLAAPLAVGTVANPVTAAAIGIALLGQHIDGVPQAIACAIAVVAGIAWLTPTANQAPGAAEPATQPTGQSAA